MTIFETKNVITDADGFRNVEQESLPIHALILGPSSAFGWGVHQNESYSEIWNESLKKSGGQVFNASVIGFSSHQGAILMEQLLQNKRLDQLKYVVIAYGINDLDRFRFFDDQSVPDSSYFSPDDPKRSQVSSVSTPSSWSIIEMAYRLKQELKIWMDCGLSEIPQKRVSWQEFENNIRNLVDKTRALGAKPILINTSFYAPNPVAAQSAQLSEQHYKMSVDEHHRKRCASSRENFKLAKRYEVGRIVEDVKKLNAIVQRIAQETNAAVVDATKLEATTNPKQYYFDPVHPSLLGHKLIAQQLLKAAEKAR